MSWAELVTVFQHLRIPCCVFRGIPGVIGRNVPDSVPDSTDEEAETIADRVYSYVWQRSASGQPLVVV